MRARAIFTASVCSVLASHLLRLPAAKSGVLAPTGVIIGRVVTVGAGFPLAYSVVSIESLKRERFTDDSGRFVLNDIPAGRVVVLAKHIGYGPVDYPVTVGAGDTVRIKIEMAKIAIPLPAMTSVGNCSKPGPPRQDLNPALFSLFDQVRQNAERSRLLVRSYPFMSTVLRVKSVQSSRTPGADPDTIAVDTFVVSSQRDWRYKPGNMVVPEPDAQGYHFNLMLPELGDIADDDFVANHCFGYGGVERVDGDPMIRVDFAPADKIKQPDIAGSLYLDSATFQIRRAEITLTKPSPVLLETLNTVTVLSRYSELAPGIPMMSNYSSTTALSKGQQAAGLSKSMVDQSILDVVWLKGKP